MSKLAGRPRKTREELIRIWQKVDKNNDGTVSVEDILQQSKVLETECPEFIKNFERVQDGGKVTRQAFLNFCLGLTKSTTSIEIKREVDLAELKQLFDEIATKGSPPQLQLSDLVQHKVRIKAIFPELLDGFTEADLDKSCSLSWEEVKIFAAGTEDWLEYQFDRVIGLDTLKDQLRQFYRSITLDKKRREAGHDVKSGGKYHMIFQGNPGTGKTTVARLVAQLLNRIGIIQSDLLVEVQRDKLVAEYVGQTGPKTQKIIEEAKPGVLFIDEAYRLSQNGGKSDFGKEAIEQLMGAMNEPPGQAPVMVFAGYPDDMEEFMKANSGLYRRIAYTFDFTDYSPKDLAQILDHIAGSAGFRLAESLVKDEYASLAKIIEENTLREARALMNGGICERIFTFAKQSLDARETTAEADVGKPPSVELLSSDILGACKKIPPPPPRESAGGRGASAADLSAGGSSKDELGRLSARNSALETEVARLNLEVASSRSVVTDLARAKAELEALRKASAGDAGAASADALAKAEGRAASAEAEVKQLRTLLDAGGTAGTTQPPKEYEVQPCLRYSCGCLCFFLMVCSMFCWRHIKALAIWSWKWFKIFMLWCWKWIQIFVRWCADKIQGKGKVAPEPKDTTAVVPAAADP